MTARVRTRLRWLDLVILIGCVTLSVSSAAGQNGMPTPTLKIPHVNRAPKLEAFLNGILREAELVVTDFRQFDPGDGDRVSQPTTRAPFNCPIVRLGDLGTMPDTNSHWTTESGPGGTHEQAPRISPRWQLSKLYYAHEAPFSEAPPTRESIEKFRRTRNPMG